MLLAWRTVGMSCLAVLDRITVPWEPEEQKRSVPFQLLLLLEKMQASRQKAVLPMELAYCLQKYDVPCKSLSAPAPIQCRVGKGLREGARGRADGQ